MLIDVQDIGLNYVLNGCLLSIFVVMLISLFPWRLRDGCNRWTLLLPWLALGLYGAYEFSMPTRMNIRLDLVVIWPLIGITFLAWFIRLMRIRLLKRNQ